MGGRAKGVHVDKLYRKRLLVAEALNDLLAKRPISEITVIELCEAAGISRSTFYAYFDDIYAVGEWLWDQEFREIFEGLGLEYGYRECFRRLFARLKELGSRVGYVRPMRPLSGDKTYASSNTLSAMIGCTERALGRRLTSEELVRLEYTSCAEEAMTLKWFTDGMRLSPEVMATLITEAAPQFLKDAVGE